LDLRGSRPIYFDIETTGFSGIEDRLICVVALQGHHFSIYRKTAELAEAFKQGGVSGIIITYNGENWQSGFDIPFLRTVSICNGIPWFLKGYMHLDLYPLITKYINTCLYTEKLPARSRLRKHDLKKLAFANDIEYSTVGDTFKHLKKLHEEGRADWLDYSKVKAEDKNSLQDVYQMLFDPEGSEEYIDGGKVPELYKKGEMETIVKHCRRDVVRLKKVCEAVLPCIPEHELDRGIRDI